MLERIENGLTKLFPRLMAVFMACMLPVFALSIVSNLREQSQVREKITALQERNASYYLRLLEQEVSRLKDITYAYMNDREFQSLAVIYDHMSDYVRAETTENVREKLGHIRQISPYASTLYLYLPSLMRSVNTRSFDYELDQDQVLWFMEQKTLGVPVQNEAGQLMICSYYPTTATINQLPVMMLGIELNKDRIRSILHEASSRAALVGSNWNVWTESGSLQSMPGYGQLAAMIGGVKKGSQTMEWDHEQCLFLWEYSPILDATLVTYISQNEIIGRLRGTQRFLWILLVVAVIMLTLTASGIWRMVHMPMRRMVDAFQEVEKGNNDVRLSLETIDEFNYLYRGFNQMMDQLNELIRQVYTQRILSQQAQLKQLQMQINPHFFYNSFFAIRGMIEMGDDEAASKMLGNIGRYFRYITRNARDVVPLKEEVSHARDYCEIQQIRFENINTCFDPLPEELEYFEVPRLILQPLIENAFVHSLENKEDEGILNVHFRTDEKTVQIIIEDNGGRMDEVQIAQIKDNLDRSNEIESTGMINIHRRLKLFFGEEAGIEILCNEMKGMTLVIVMPKREA